ncbi:MAG TPA: hypothetical protein VHS31_08235 [Tepidisphaeraceae bacterium]|jgi:hypothetical protein|nr:hypothetical protein [Tepidisphaeraceae bacterium]
MYPLEGERLLEAWDHACILGELDRAPQLLAIACPETTTAQWAAASILELNLNLLRLRLITFGPQLTGYLPCPTCQTRLEFAFDIRAVIEHLESLASRESANFTIAGTDFPIRRLNTQDLISVRGEIDPDKAQRMLLTRCLSATANQSGFDSHEITVASQAEAMEIFSDLNEGAEIICQASCVECGNSHRFDLDIARFLWSEIRNRALHLMRDVDELASAYGWSEQAILAMTPQRRQQYGGMIRA